MLGFGVFVANCAVRFTQYDDGGMHGWGVSQQGTLDEDELGYLTALFVELRGGGDEKLALAHLADGPRAAFKRSLARFRKERRGVIERLRAIVPRPPDGAPYR